MMESVESKVAKAILEKEDKVVIEGVEYRVSPPSLATLIMVSEYIAELPEFTKDTSFAAAISMAKDCEALAKIAAILILGAKRIKEGRIVESTETCIKIGWSWRRFGLHEKVVKKKVFVPEIDNLSGMLANMQPRDLGTIITARLANMQVTDFFGLTASLRGINLTKRTKEEAETQLGE